MIRYHWIRGLPPQCSCEARHRETAQPPGQDGVFPSPAKLTARAAQPSRFSRGWQGLWYSSRADLGWTKDHGYGIGLPSGRLRAESAASERRRHHVVGFGASHPMNPDAVPLSNSRLKRARRHGDDHFEVDSKISEFSDCPQWGIDMPKWELPEICRKLRPDVSGSRADSP